MDIEFISQFDQSADNLGVGVFSNKKLSEAARELDSKFNGAISAALEISSSVGKFGKIVEVFSKDGEHNKRIFLIGLGDENKLDNLSLQKIGGHIYNHLKQKLVVSPVLNLGLVSSNDVNVNEATAHVAYGMRLRSWRFDKYMTKQDNDSIPHIQLVKMVASDSDKAGEYFFDFSCVADGVATSKTLAIEPPNVLYPETYAEFILDLRKHGLEVDVMDEKTLRKMGMNALLGVSQGSVKPPKVVVMKWSGGDDKEEAPLAFVGKGVCFDSGGLSLKTPSTYMEDMKYDMCGSAVVVGLMQALAQRRAKINAVGVVGLVENMPSGSAQRPGDVVTSMSGQTIEILNTDAEGRLVLADILWYTQDQFKPKLIVDLATLTGAITVSFADEYAGVFSNNSDLVEKLVKSGDKVDEKLWRMPICKAYDKAINSEIADVRNTGKIKGAGSSTAAQFLHRFVNNYPWAHLDIAGVSWNNKNIPYCSDKGPTAFGVRLLNTFIKDNYENDDNND